MKSYFYSQLNEEEYFDEKEFLKRIVNIIDNLEVPNGMTEYAKDAYEMARAIAHKKHGRARDDDVMDEFYKIIIDNTQQYVKNQIIKHF